MRPELEIHVEEKDNFKKVINDYIDIERRLAANSSIRKNKNMEYSKSDEPINNKNNNVSRLNVVREDNLVCLICEKPGYATEKCFQQRYNDFNGQRSSNNDCSRKNYNNFPNNKFSRNKTYSFKNNNHFLQNRNNNYRIDNTNFLQQRYNNNNNFSRNSYYNNNNVNNNNRQLNVGQYKKFHSGQFQNRSKPYENRFFPVKYTRENSNYTEIACNFSKKPGHSI